MTQEMHSKTYFPSHGAVATLVGLGIYLLFSSVLFAAQTEIRILTWPSYTNAGLIERFEEETGISVVLDIFESNEELAEILRRGWPRYDVVVPSDSWIALLSEEGLLLPFDTTTLEGFENIGEQWLSPYFDPGLLYSSPFLWGTVSFMVNTEVYEGPRDSLLTLFQPPLHLQGRVGMMTDSRDVIDLALRHLDLPACTKDPIHLNQLRELLLRQKRVVGSYSMVEDVVEQTARGKIVIQMIYNGAAMRARLRNPAVEYVYPREGIIVWSDNLAIPSNASHVAGARQFLEFFLRPEIIAVQSNTTFYGNMIEGSSEYLDAPIKKARELIIPPTVPVSYIPVCSDEIVTAYHSLWNEIVGNHEFSTK